MSGEAGAPRPLDDAQIEILDLVRYAQRIGWALVDTADLAEATGMPRWLVRAILRELEGMGLVERPAMNSGSSDAWSLTREGREFFRRRCDGREGVAS